MEIRYHLDEHLDPAIAAGLRRRGVDVTTTVEAGLSGASDFEQLAFATRNHRVLVTRDTDFLALSAEGMSHGGIAFWHSRHRSVGQLILDLTLLWRVYAAEDMANRVEYL
ncbi:MAG: DUF5615 family PIN-like protein [Pirellulaceae bacterium]|nr:DUF5615 family PIN-like protein [Pirellulaceae bacterium]